MTLFSVFCAVSLKRFYPLRGVGLFSPTSRRHIVIRLLILLLSLSVANFVETFGDEFFAATGSRGNPPNAFTSASITDGILTPIGSESVFNADIDFTMDGSLLYGVGTSLRTIDPVTGSINVVGGFAFEGNPLFMLRLTVSPNGRLLGIGLSERRVFEIEPNTAELTFLSEPTENLSFMEFTPDGRLFGVAGVTLYELAPSDGTILSEVRRLSAPFRNGTIGSDGTLYGLDLGLTTIDSLHSLVDIPLTASGSETLVATFLPPPGPGNTFISSIAIAPTAIPEPGSFAVLAAMTAVVGSRRQRRESGQSNNS
ncbi:MAG: hypothetical protein AAGJ40_23510 [Planctomycetota bacterium]